jgi:hypothetical protein
MGDVSLDPKRLWVCIKPELQPNQSSQQAPSWTTGNGMLFPEFFGRRRAVIFSDPALAQAFLQVLGVTGFVLAQFRSHEHMLMFFRNLPGIGIHDIAADPKESGGKGNVDIFPVQQAIDTLNGFLKEERKKRRAKRKPKG